MRSHLATKIILTSDRCNPAKSTAQNTQLGEARYASGTLSASAPLRERDRTSNRS